MTRRAMNPEQSSLAELNPSQLEPTSTAKNPEDQNPITYNDDSQMYSSFSRIFFNNIAGFSGFLFFGYCLVYVSDVPYEQQIM